jgi:nucleoside-diphosphate-sugar epimerase
VHRLDAAHAFRLALEKAAKGVRYNPIGDEEIKIRDIAEIIAKIEKVPVKSITVEEARIHFEWMSYFITFDSPALLKRPNRFLRAMQHSPDFNT